MKSTDKRLNDIEQAFKYQEKCWKRVDKTFNEFLDAIKEYRQTILVQQKDDAYYLGYCIGATGRWENNDEEMLLDHLEEGFYEGRERRKNEKIQNID